MRAFQLSNHSELPNIIETDTPKPEPGEALVRIEACGLNFADLLMMTGQYQEIPPTPFTLGIELSGTIEAVGDIADRNWVGQRVSVFAGQGGLAEYGCFRLEQCVKMPDAMTFEDAAAFQVAYGTSHLALSHKAKLQPGETLLVLGAAGGVGLTAIEIGKRMGAKVIACARGSEKLEIAKKAGADHLIDSTQANLTEKVKAIGGADVIYDPVGGQQFSDAFRACNPEGRILVIGFASGDLPSIPANHLLVKNISILGFYWGGYLKFAPKTLTDSLVELFDWYEKGDIRPHISRVYPLSQATEAFELLRARRSTGKVVVAVRKQQ